jgi:DNA-binding CsgD family transcriptional regulator
MTGCVHCGAVEDEEHGIVVGLSEDIGECVCNVCLWQDLAKHTSLSPREVQVGAIKKLTGASHSRIAGIMDIDKSTVDEYSRRIKNKAKKAAVAADKLEGFN